MNNPIYDMTRMTERFAREVINLPIPEKPTRLNPSRKSWAISAITEETTEFEKAETLEQEADALIDLTYFALGRLVEMGLAPRALFEEVHRANMDKVQGELSKRPGSLGHDAIKPEGWVAPQLDDMLAIDRDTIVRLMEHKRAELLTQHFVPAIRAAGSPIGDNNPKIILLGYARHGKDTVAEMLEKHFGLRHVSSSYFCAERVVFPKVRAEWDRWEKMVGTGVAKPQIPDYADAKDCFEDRMNRRQFWFETIRDYNNPELHRLGTEILTDHDIYVGLRNHRELYALQARAAADLVLWVDRSDHLPPEDRTSCTVEPWMADLVLDNNGTEGQTLAHLTAIMEQYLHRLPEGF